MVSLCLSLAEPSTASVVFWSHPRLAKSTTETSICSTALGQSICVISTWYLLNAGCGFRSMPNLGTSSQCYCTEQQWMYFCLSPVLSSIPTGIGGLASFRRALEGVSNSGVFKGIPLRQSLWTKWMLHTGGGWGETPPHDCKAHWVYNNIQKALYKCIIHSFIHFDVTLNVTDW